MVSESVGLQQMEWARLASESEYAENKRCPCCEQDLRTCGNMARHMEKHDNADFLQYAGKSGDQHLIKIFVELTAEGLKLACPCCRAQFSRSEFASKFLRHTMATKNTVCLKDAGKSKDPVELKIYNKTLPQ